VFQNQCDVFFCKRGGVSCCRITSLGTFPSICFCRHFQFVHEDASGNVQRKSSGGKIVTTLTGTLIFHYYYECDVGYADYIWVLRVLFGCVHLE